MRHMGELSAGFLQWLSGGEKEKLGTIVKSTQTNTNLHVQRCFVQFRAVMRQMGELSAGFLQWLSGGKSENLGTKAL